VNITVPADVLVAFLLATVRSAAWLAITPPLNGRTVPGIVKAGLAAALALPVASRLTGSVPVDDTGALVTAAVVQVAIGLAIGFIGLLLLSTIRAAGDLVDLFGGFTLSQAYDPLSMTSGSLFGRLHQLLMTTLLFVTGGYLLLVRGFLASYDVIPLDKAPSLAMVTDVVVHGLGTLFVAALQVAIPLLCASFLADLGLGLLSRTAPSLNVFAMGFPVKVLLTLALVGFLIPLLPHAVGLLVDHTVHDVGKVASTAAGP
jgi:flagellar biosynthetic protein FliR